MRLVCRPRSSPPPSALVRCCHLLLWKTVVCVFSFVCLIGSHRFVHHIRTEGILVQHMLHFQLRDCACACAFWFFHRWKRHKGRLSCSFHFEHHSLPLPTSRRCAHGPTLPAVGHHHHPAPARLYHQNRLPRLSSLQARLLSQHSLYAQLSCGCERVFVPHEAYL